MVIGEDPKYLMQNKQGVLTLNIRKPCLFDSGRYSCRAVNDLGQDEVECKVEVRGREQPVQQRTSSLANRRAPFLGRSLMRNKASKPRGSDGQAGWQEVSHQ